MAGTNGTTVVAAAPQRDIQTPSPLGGLQRPIGTSERSRERDEAKEKAVAAQRDAREFARRKLAARRDDRIIKDDESDERPRSRRVMDDDDAQRGDVARPRNLDRDDEPQPRNRRHRDDYHLQRVDDRDEPDDDLDVEPEATDEDEGDEGPSLKHISKSVIAAAREAGFEDDEIASMQSDREVLNSVTLSLKRMRSARQEREEEPEPAAARQQAEPEEDDKDDEPELKLDTSDLDESTAKLFTSLRDHFTSLRKKDRAEIKALKQARKAEADQRAAEQRQRNYTEFSNALASMVKAHPGLKAVYGTGDPKRMNPRQSVELEGLIKDIGQYRTGVQFTRGGRMPPMDELVSMFVTAKHPDKLSRNKAGRERETDAGERARQRAEEMLEPSIGRSAARGRGNESGRSFVHRFMRSRGLGR